MRRRVEQARRVKDAHNLNFAAVARALTAAGTGSGIRCKTTTFAGPRARSGVENADQTTASYRVNSAQLRELKRRWTSRKALLVK